MTDRHVAYIVILEEPVREDDAESTTLNALKMIKGVVEVKPVKQDIMEQVVHARIKYELRNKILEILK